MLKDFFFNSLVTLIFHKFIFGFFYDFGYKHIIEAKYEHHQQVVSYVRLKRHYSATYFLLFSYCRILFIRKKFIFLRAWILSKWQIRVRIHRNLKLLPIYMKRYGLVWAVMCEHWTLKYLTFLFILKSVSFHNRSRLLFWWYLNHAMAAVSLPNGNMSNSDQQILFGTFNLEMTILNQTIFEYCPWSFSIHRSFSNSKYFFLRCFYPLWLIDCKISRMARIEFVAFVCFFFPVRFPFLQHRNLCVRYELSVIFTTNLYFKLTYILSFWIRNEWGKYK